MGRRQKHSKEFKLEALRLMEDQSRSVTEIADSLGVERAMLYRWKRSLKGEGNEAFRGAGKRTAEASELERLRKEVRDLKLEREILKKVAALWGRSEQ